VACLRASSGRSSRAWAFISRESRSYVPAVVTRIRTKDRFPSPHFFVSVARGPEVSRVRSITDLCCLRVSVESYLAPKGPMKCKRCQRFGHTQRHCGSAPRCVACGRSHLSGGCSTPREQPQCYGFGSNHTANYRGCVKWKEGRAALAKQAPQRAPRNAPVAPKAQQAATSAEQLVLGEGLIHIFRGVFVAKTTATTPPPNPSPPLQPVT